MKLIKPNPKSTKVQSSSNNSSSDDSSSDDSSSSNSSSSSSSGDDSDSSSSTAPPPPTTNNKDDNRPSSAASGSSTRSLKPKPPLVKTGKKQVKKPVKKATPPAPPVLKSKLIKSGTVTNTRTIKPLVPVKKPPPVKKPTIIKEKKVTLVTKPNKVKKPVVKLPVAPKVISKTLTIPSKTIKKKPLLKKSEKPESSSLIIRTRSSCSSANSTSTSSSDEDVKKKIEKKNVKRPVTRRQKLAGKKTIPTTTLFNQSLLLAATQQVEKKPSPPSSCNSSPTTTNQLPSLNPTSTTPLNKNKYLSTWDSDFSDDQNQNLIRVPAKTSLKPPPSNLPLSYYDTYQPPTCPFPSCDSSGHLSGKYPTHNFLSCCPKYNGLTEDECEKNDEERSRRENERSRYRNILSTPGKKPPKQTTETKSWLNNIKELKNNQLGVVSCYDDLLWKDAMAIAADSIEKEQNEGGINNTQQIQNFRVATMAVAMGRFEMKCWCDSPYPEPLSQNRRLFVCEFCLKPVGSGTVLRRHCAKCVWRHPPGDEIYRKDRLSVWEVDGKKQKTYCQNLCLLAKCFLDHKTLYLDVDPFLFYVMTLADSQGCHIVGYFSKEKNSFLNYNVSCILTLPPYQRQGFGRLLIDFSYLLTRVEGKVGSPEKPLSDLGLISYRSYWKDACLRRLCACASREINIKDLSIELGVSTADLISTLQYLGMLKYWKGKHLVLKKQDVLEEYLERVRRRGNEQRQIDSSCLRWRPYQPPTDEQSSEEKS